MNTIRHFQMLLIFFACFISVKSGYGQFQNVYGNSADNFFIKAFPSEGGYYVIGAQNESATLSRIHTSGELLWTLRIEEAENLVDGIVLANNNLIVIGSGAEQSIIAEITPGGSLNCVRLFDSPGTEMLAAIDRNPDGISYSIVGFNTSAGTLNDIVVLNMSSPCTINSELQFFNPGNDDFGRTIEVLESGDFLLCGTDGTSAVIYQMTGAEGIFVNGVQGPVQYIYTDIHELTGTGDILAIANNAGDAPHIMRFNADLLPVWEVSISGVESLAQIVDDGSGNIYVIGTTTILGQQRTLLIKLNADGTELIWESGAKYIGSVAQSYGAGSIALVSTGEIVYVDALSEYPGSFGLFDAFMAVLPDDLISACTYSTSVSLNPENTLFDGPIGPAFIFDTIANGDDAEFSALAWSQGPACLSTCQAGYTFIQLDDCGQVQFTDISTGNGPFSYCWDFDSNLSNCEDATMNPVWQFSGVPCQTVSACLIITATDGCKDTVCQSIQIDDLIEPIIICPDDITLSCNFDISPGTTGVATGFDNCSPNVTMTYSDAVVAIPCPTVITRTWTATDDCGNTSICFQIIVIDDTLPPQIINCPPNITVTVVGSPSPCSQFVSIGIPYGQDNCDSIGAIINDHNFTSDASDYYPNGTTMVCYTATDNCGNSATCKFSVTVICIDSTNAGAYCGQAVVTCFSGFNLPQNPSTGLNPNGNVVAFVDPRALTNITANGMDAAALVPMTKSPQWVQSRMGQVFGIAIDNNSQIFVTASTRYGKFINSITGVDMTFGSAGAGGIYQIDPLTGNVTDFVTTTSNPNPIGLNAIYNTGSGLGDIAFDKVNQQFFVTNFTDGKIYRIDNNGIVQSTYDHPGSTTFPPSDATFIAGGERPFAVQMHPFNGRLYYAVWSEDGGRQSAVNSNEIWSIAIDPTTKDFLGVATCEIQIPALPLANHSNAPSDIAFSHSGKLLLGEWTTDRDFPLVLGNAAHASRLLEYTPGPPTGTSCNPTWGNPKEIYVGNFLDNRNCSGGVDFGYSGFDFNQLIPLGCDEIVWSMGDALKYGPSYNYYPSDNELVYGLAGMPESGNSNVFGGALPYVKTSSYYIDLGANNKAEFGDVEVFKCLCATNSNNFVCDSLYVWDSLWTQGGNCCYTVDLDIQVGPVAYIDATVITPGVTFSNTLLNGPFTPRPASGLNMYSFEYNIPPSIPIGAYPNAFSFCLSNILFPSQVPQQVEFTWYVIGVNNIPYPACRDTLTFSCPPPVLGDTCVVVTNDTVFCDSTNVYEYFFQFQVQNVSNFIATQVTLISNTPGLEFVACPPTISTVTSPSITLPLGAPLNINGISAPLCVKISTLTPLLAPTTFCIDIALSSSNASCTAPAPHCITLVPCCDPCLDRGFVLSMTNTDSCCHTLDIINNCAYAYFTGLELELLTPGISFGSHYTGGSNPGDWVNGQSTNTVIEWNHVSGTIPQGTFPGLINFCIDEIDQNETPQVVVLHWLNPLVSTNDSIACSDTLVFHCDTTEYGCITVLSDTVKCRYAANGAPYYEYELFFQNTSAPPHAATHINFQQIAGPAATITPNPILLTPALNPNGTATIQTNILGSTLVAGDKLTYLVTLMDAVNPDNWFCHEADTICIFIPQCDTCVCADPNLVLTHNGLNYPLSCPVAVGSGPLLTCPTGNVTVSGFVGCEHPVSLDPCPTKHVGWQLNGPNGPLYGGSTSATFSLTFPSSDVDDPGIYDLTFITICGGAQDTCRCTVYWEQPPCDTCACGDLLWANVYGVGANPQPMWCDTTPFSIPCKKTWPDLFIDGAFTCAPDSCGNDTVTWVLDRPGNLIDKTGTYSSSGTYPYFSVNIPWGDVVNPGAYTLTITRKCGDKICSCKFNFVVPDCPCMCNDLKKDVGKGFLVNGSNFSCKRKLRPYKLCPNDQVTWTVNGLPVGTTQGNGSLNYTFSSTGTYTVCMIVHRIDPITLLPCTPPGMYCRKVFVFCPFKPKDTHIVACPGGNKVKNGDFSEGLLTGRLGSVGSVSNWELFPNTGDGLAFIDSTGSSDDGQVILIGRKDNFAGITQRVNVAGDSAFIGLTAFNYLDEDLPPGTVLEFRLQDEGFPDSNAHFIYRYEIDTSFSSWAEIAIAVPMDVEPGVYSFVICVQNSSDNTYSTIGIDDIEFCTDPSVGFSDLQRLVNVQVYPNPNTGEFTVDLSDLAIGGTSLRIVGLTGQLLSEQKIENSNPLQNVDANMLPEGMYILQIISEGRVTAVSKFVKM